MRLLWRRQKKYWKKQSLPRRYVFTYALLFLKKISTNHADTEKQGIKLKTYDENVSLFHILIGLFSLHSALLKSECQTRPNPPDLTSPLCVDTLDLSLLPPYFLLSSVTLLIPLFLNFEERVAEVVYRVRAAFPISVLPLTIFYSLVPEWRCGQPTKGETGDG